MRSASLWKRSTVHYGLLVVVFGVFDLCAGPATASDLSRAYGQVQANSKGFVAHPFAHWKTIGQLGEGAPTYLRMLPPDVPLLMLSPKQARAAGYDIEWRPELTEGQRLVPNEQGRMKNRSAILSIESTLAGRMLPTSLIDTHQGRPPDWEIRHRVMEFGVENSPRVINRVYGYEDGTWHHEAWMSGMAGTFTLKDPTQATSVINTLFTLTSSREVLSGAALQAALWPNVVALKWADSMSHNSDMIVGTSAQSSSMRLPYDDLEILHLDKELMITAIKMSAQGVSDWFSSNILSRVNERLSMHLGELEDQLVLVHMPAELEHVPQAHVFLTWLGNQFTSRIQINQSLSFQTDESGHGIAYVPHTPYSNILGVAERKITVRGQSSVRDAEGDDVEAVDGSGGAAPEELADLFTLEFTSRAEDKGASAAGAELWMMTLEEGW